MSNIEVLRQLLRRRFRYNSRFYRMGSQLVNVVALLMRCGLEFTITLLRLKCLPIGTEVTLSFPGITYPFLVRAGTDDVGTVINNFVRCEYGKVPCELIPATIIDAGAYIVDTSAFFLSRYPNARVIALEPSAINSAVAEKNLAPYGERVSLRRGGLRWGRKGVRFDLLAIRPQQESRSGAMSSQWLRSRIFCEKSPVDVWTFSNSTLKAPNV